MSKVNLDLVLAKLDHLPTLPTVAHKVGELVNDPDSSSRDIAEVMKQDQALSARVLALVNSAYYGVPGGVTDVRRAISYLGFNTVYQLVLTISIFDTLPKVEGSEFSVQELWKHSLGCAIASESVARRLGHKSPEDLFTAGLLHDIGKVVLAAFFTDALEEVVRGATKDGVTFSEKEREMRLPGHDDIGRRLAERWRLPAALSAGIGYHHALNGSSRITLPKHLHSVADMVALGDTLCRRSGIGNAGDPVVPAPDRDLLERLNLTELTLGKLEDDIPRTIERSKTFLELLG
jgi:putative nucleotidyltransferase with HDIG domain